MSSNVVNFVPIDLKIGTHNYWICNTCGGGGCDTSHTFWPPISHLPQFLTPNIPPLTILTPPTSHILAMKLVLTPMVTYMYGRNIYNSTTKSAYTRMLTSHQKFKNKTDIYKSHKSINNASRPESFDICIYVFGYLVRYRKTVTLSTSSKKILLLNSKVDIKGNDVIVGVG